VTADANGTVTVDPSVPEATGFPLGFTNDEDLVSPKSFVFVADTDNNLQTFERFDPGMQSPRQAWRVLRQMIEEIDPIVDALRDRYPFDLSRIGIGGMSLGGMAALARLTRPHAFAAASVEATTGSWAHQREREMFEPAAPDDVRRLEPIQNLDGWREIPLQAFHSRLDEWVAYEGQETFIEALRARYEDPSMVEFVVYDRTGAPNEHAGFGRKATDAKARQTDFFRRWLLAPDR